MNRIGKIDKTVLDLCNRFGWPNRYKCVLRSCWGGGVEKLAGLIDTPCEQTRRKKGARPLPSRANSEIATALSLRSFFCAVPLRLFWNVGG